MNRIEPAAIQDIAEPVGPVLTKADLAKRWQVSVDTIERIVSERLLRCFRIGRIVRFRLRDIEEFEAARLTRARAF